MAKNIIFISFFFGSSLTVQSQNIDSILANPPTIELGLSNPQPRLGEDFYLTYDQTFIEAQIFKPAWGLFQISDENSETREVKLKLNALKKGKTVFGPFAFTINNIPYKTDSIQIEVIDALPKVNEGVWIRKVYMSNSKFAIILEQRVPNEKKVENIAPNQTRYWNEPINNNYAKIAYTRNINGVRHHTSTSLENDSYVYDDKGERLGFRYIFSIAYFEIVDKSAKIDITKDWFDQLPESYSFKNIPVQ